MKFRTQWYREQRNQEQALMAAKAAGRPKPVPDLETCWARAQRIADQLAPTLEHLLRRMRPPEPGEPPPIVTISLTADLPTGGLPPWIDPPARVKAVALWGRHRVAAGGAIAELPVVCKLQLSATVTVYGPRSGDGSTVEMSRNAWDFPLKSAERQALYPEKQLAIK